VPRQLLHARVADALPQVGRAKVTAEPEVIAHHLQSAGRLLEAISYWREAGERSVRRAANREAIEHFRRALSLLETRPETAERWRAELPILSQLGPALMSVYGWTAPEAAETVERAARIGRRLTSSPDLAPAIANLGVFSIYRGLLEQAEEASTDLFRIARELNDHGIMLQAHHCAWPVRWHRGQFAQACEHCDAGLALYDSERHAQDRFAYFGHDPAVCALACGAAATWVLGYPAGAMRRHGEAVVLARKLRDAPSLAHSLMYVCDTSQKACIDPTEMLGYATELQELSSSHGFPQFQAYALVFLGWTLICSGEPSRGIAQMGDGLDVLRRLGSRVFMSRGHCLMAEAHLMARQHRQALEHVAQALGRAEEIGEEYVLARLHHLRGELLLHLHGSNDEAEAAEVSLRHAISVARRQGAKGWELPAATSLARLWADRDRRTEARELLAPIYGWFTEGLDTPDLQAAKALLDALDA
jgi:predicted ATPase